jgi:hypothetical protein
MVCRDVALQRLYSFIDRQIILSEPSWKLPRFKVLIMEELLTLEDLLLQGDVQGALLIVEELEKPVNREEIINRALVLILPGESS